MAGLDATVDDGSVACRPTRVESPVFPAATWDRAVAADYDGTRLAVVHLAIGQVEEQFGVQLDVADVDGGGWSMPIGEALRPLGLESPPTVAVAVAAGEVGVAWSALRPQPEIAGRERQLTVKAVGLDQSGAVIRPEQVLNTDFERTEVLAFDPVIAHSTGAGSFVVGWTDQRYVSSDDIYPRTGAFVRTLTSGPELRVNVDEVGGADLPEEPRAGLDTLSPMDGDVLVVAHGRQGEQGESPFHVARLLSAGTLGPARSISQASGRVRSVARIGSMLVWLQGEEPGSFYSQTDVDANQVTLPLYDVRTGQVTTLGDHFILAYETRDPYEFHLDTLTPEGTLTPMMTRPSGPERRIVSGRSNGDSIHLVWFDDGANGLVVVGETLCLTP